MTRPTNIEEGAQLLKGIGASSWFHIAQEGDKYRIKRYSETGKIECSLIFYVNNKTFNIQEPFKFTYISHCKECVILQEKKKYIFRLYINED